MPIGTYSKWLLSLLSLKWFFAGAVKALRNGHSENEASTKRGAEAIKELWIFSFSAKWLILQLAREVGRSYYSVTIDSEPMEKFESSMSNSQLTETFSRFAKQGFLYPANDLAYISELIEKEPMEFLNSFIPKHLNLPT